MRVAVIAILALLPPAEAATGCCATDEPAGVTAPAQTDRHHAFEVTIYSAIEWVVPDADDLRVICFTGTRDIGGCTRFFGRKLECGCVTDGSRWAMVGRVGLVPFMYLSEPYFESHEQLHVGDIKLRLERHLNALTRLRFDSKTDCEAAADRERSSFSDLLDSYMHASNLRFH